MSGRLKDVTAGEQHSALSRACCVAPGQLSSAMSAAATDRHLRTQSHSLSSPACKSAHATKVVISSPSMDAPDLEHRINDSHSKASIRGKRQLITCAVQGVELKGQFRPITLRKDLMRLTEWCQGH